MPVPRLTHSDAEATFSSTLPGNDAAAALEALLALLYIHVSV